MKTFFLITLAAGGVCIAGLLLYTRRHSDEQETGSKGLEAPQMLIPGEAKELLPLESSAQLDTKLVRECSGFARSRKYPEIYWTISDSGAPPNIYAMRADGSIIKPPGAGKNYQGIRVKGATNIDWEAICLGHDGRLIVADTGNNTNSRQNLALYIFPEPDPQKDAETETAHRVPVKFEQQEQFPDPQKRYDCEAIFSHGNELYAFTKRRKDTWTVLHRLKHSSAGVAVFTPVTAFNSRGMVTDAATSPDEHRLVVLTYHGIWLFELSPAGTPNPLSGPAWYARLQFPLNTWQVEAVAFEDDSHLLIGSEQGALYKLELSRLSKMR
ncbi:MAG: hypothetical protein LBD01_00795 [Puniceicoccales bacterium]|jgi:hypothetical protein|nr:hypothetical protein [Puniceicoccales bacterium]